MAGFEPYTREAMQLEAEIARCGVVLGIDWQNETTVRLLAHELVNGGSEHIRALARSENTREKAKGQLFALAILMQQTMAESAEYGIHTHGGEIWKALGSAIMRESDARKPRD